MKGILDVALLASAIRLSTPLLLAACGGLFCERSGVVNIALEGLMLIGAFAGATVAYFSGSAWVGVLAAATAGAVVASLHALASVRWRADQIVSGAGINILALGATPFLAKAIFDTTGSTPPIANPLPELHIPLIDGLPVIGTVLSGHSPLVYIAWIVVIAAYFVVYKTVFGLRLRACGENPHAARAAGINVEAVRTVAVLISGVLAGTAGAFLSVSHGSQFVRNMTAGRGFLALAALIFGKWTPGGTFGACLLFGFADALQMRLQGTGTIPVQFVQMIPYILTMVVLVGFVGRATPPASLGRPYYRESG